MRTLVERSTIQSLMRACSVEDARSAEEAVKALGNLAANENHAHKIVEAGGGSMGKKVVVFAKRDLQVGEELQYDYQFALGSSSEKIACYCGAPNCWGRMN